MKPWQAVLDFWFGDQDPPELAYQKRWFKGGEELDRTICECFNRPHQRFQKHQASLDSFVVTARVHREIIFRFGRYPHRNSVLGPVSTAEEANYLASNAARFGQ